MSAVTQSAVGLNDRPRSSTKRQHQMLVLAGSNRGMDLAEVRRIVGGSLRALSAVQASEYIKQFTGHDLPNPPGGKRFPYTRRVRGREQRTPRIITADHIEQIGRLMLRYFDNNVVAAQKWFEKNWKVKEPAQLGTIEQAGKVIKVLKDMVKRNGGAT